MCSVYCLSDDCVNNDGTKCQLNKISINDYQECEDYRPYNTQLTYQNEYWIATRSKANGNILRKLRKGKKIELEEMVFYTSNDDRYPEETWLTEARSGVLSGNLQLLHERIDDIRKKAAEFPDVMSLEIWERETKE